MTILAWCLIAVGCYLALYGLRKRRTDKFIAALPPKIQAEIEDAAHGAIREDIREDAIKQVLAKYKAEGLKIRQEAIRQGLGPDALPPLDEWPFKNRKDTK